MTLIVAEVENNDAFVVADTLITSDYRSPNAAPGPVNGDFHALKVHILHPTVCVAIAGNFDVGLQTVEAFKVSGLNLEQEDPDRLAEALLDFYRNIVRDVTPCDFLLLVARLGSNRLFKLEAGLTHPCQRAYIGDPYGYRCLQALRKPYKSPVGSFTQLADGSFIKEQFVRFGLEQSFEELTDAMESLSASRKVESVGAIGDNVVRVRIARISGGFEYLQQVITGSSKEEGLIGTCLLAQNYEPYAVGIYYLGGQFGFVMSPGKNAFCQKIRNPTVEGFVLAVEKQFGYKLEGGTWNVD